MNKWVLAVAVITSGLLAGQSANAAISVTVTGGTLTLAPGERGYIDLRISNVSGGSPVASSFTVKASLPNSGHIYFPWDAVNSDLNSAYPALASTTPLFPSLDYVTTLDSGIYLLGINALNSGNVALTAGTGLVRIPVLADAVATAGNYPLNVTFAQFVPNTGSPVSADTLVAGTVTVAVPEPASLGLVGVVGFLAMRRQRKA